MRRVVPGTSHNIVQPIPFRMPPSSVGGWHAARKHHTGQGVLQADVVSLAELEDQVHEHVDVHLVMTLVSGVPLNEGTPFPGSLGAPRHRHRLLFDLGGRRGSVRLGLAVPGHVTLQEQDVQVGVEAGSGSGDGVHHVGHVWNRAKLVP